MLAGEGEVVEEFELEKATEPRRRQVEVLKVGVRLWEGNQTLMMDLLQQEVETVVATQGQWVEMKLWRVVQSAQHGLVDSRALMKGLQLEPEVGVVKKLMTKTLNDFCEAKAKGRVRGWQRRSEIVIVMKRLLSNSKRRVLQKPVYPERPILQG